MQWDGPEGEPRTLRSRATSNLLIRIDLLDAAVKYAKVIPDFWERSFGLFSFQQLHRAQVGYPRSRSLSTLGDTQLEGSFSEVRDDIPATEKGPTGPGPDCSTAKACWLVESILNQPFCFSHRVATT